jgi:hypothetical protein
MDKKRLVALVASFTATFLPIYLFERLANYYYLIDIPSTFFLLSGLRFTLFVVFAVVGSIVSGVLLRNLRSALATQLLAVAALLSAFYVLCASPRVCYSTGPDGLEPLRLGFILGTMCVFGASVGVALRVRPEDRRWPAVLSSLGSFTAMVYFPIVYTFAGARFFPLLYPWLLLVLLALLAFSTSATLRGLLGTGLSVLLPVLLFAIVSLLSATIAVSYLYEVAFTASILGLALLVGSLSSLVGSMMTNRRQVGRTLRVIPLVVFVVLILGSFWVIPDEVNALVPMGGNSAAPSIQMGTPVYAGGFMDAAAAPAQGIGATVTFGRTNSSSIQVDNYLSAGIGAHSPDCCVDGIDYGYRFDVYLFHNGSRSLLASAWQNCDDNAACGGHSWKALMFQKAGPLISEAVPVYLQIEWQGHVAIWSYSATVGGASVLVQFANFTAPAKENPAFNVGVVDVSSPLSSQQLAIFYQFGIMSRYPLGHGGWSVTFDCPQTLQNHTWSCVSQAETAEGGYSFWKVLWRWGEDYPNVIVTSAGNDSFTLGYSPSSTMNNRVPIYT